MAIACIVSALPPPECERRVASMVESLRHEQFQVTGTLSWPKLGLYAGWTAQLESFAASQVFTNEAGDVQLLISGECFIPPELRAELRRKGHSIGPSPGDWLVHYYEESGDRFFTSLNGLFAGLLVDLRSNRAFLFNDRYGVERLYWSETKEGAFFASEVKALLRTEPGLRHFDEQGVAQYLSYGCTVDGRTLFRGVNLATGGSLWTITGGNYSGSRYFDPAEWEALPQLTTEEFQGRLTETFSRILPAYFCSSKNVGISLTGGLDSRMIMAAQPATSVPPVCFTFTGENPRLLDSQVAAKVARACNLHHELIPIGPDFFGSFHELADRTVFATDGTCGVLGAHEIYFNQRARQLSPVRITGNFGSELLRNVSTFKTLRLASELFGGDYARFEDSCSPERLARTHPVRFAAFEEIPWNLFGTLCAGRTQVAFRTPFLDNEMVALAFQCPIEARISSASAMKFVTESNPRLGTIPTDRNQDGNGSQLHRWLRRIYSEATFKLDYYCCEGLPFGLSALDPIYSWCNRLLGIKGLHKFLDYRNWLNKELAGVVHERLEAAGPAGLPLIDASVVSKLALEHASGRKNYTREINAVLTLEAVKRLLM